MERKHLFKKGYIPWNKGLSGFRKGEPHPWKIGQVPKSAFKKNDPRVTGKNHHSWAGNNIKYRGLHRWIERILGRPGICAFCGKKNLYGHQIHWANITGKYTRNPKNWVRLCVSCHFKLDRRI